MDDTRLNGERECTLAGEAMAEQRTIGARSHHLAEKLTREPF
jgi:hypothetical protein